MSTTWFYRVLLSFCVVLISTQARGDKFVLQKFLAECEKRSWKIVLVEGNELKLWDATKKEPTSLSQNTKYVYNISKESIRDPSLGFSNEKVLLAKNLRGKDRGQIVLVDRQSGTEHRLYEGKAVKSPVLSPDEKYVAFLSEREGYSDYALYSLFTLELSSMTLINVLYKEVRIEGTYNFNISWMSDSQHIVYSDRKSRIHMINIHTKKNTFLVTGYDPICSPDGQKILFKKYPDKPYTPFIYQMSHGNVDKMRLSNVLNTIWSPDGNYVLAVKMNNNLFNRSEWRKKVVIFDTHTRHIATLFTYEGFEYLDCKQPIK